MINDKNIKATVSRKNNKIRRDYPLFFNEFKTDFDTEKQKKIDNAIDCDIHFAWMEDQNNLLWFEIEWYKRILLHLNRPDIIENCYAMYYKYYEHQNCYLADGLCHSISEIMGWIPYQVYQKAESFKIEKPY